MTARWLATSPMPYRGRTLDVEFDFIDHMLVMRTSDGATRRMRLVSRSVADFYDAYLAELAALGIKPRIWPVPVEVDVAIPFAEDREHTSYDGTHANNFWRILVQVDRVMKRFRGEFLGKSSPVHFFWGSLDMAVTRFSGRSAPRHPGGFPNCPDYVAVEAYSHEVSSAGFWPGNDAFPEPAFYAYAYPEPPGFSEAPLRPEAASYHPGLREFILPYDAVRSADAPDETLLAFLRTTYEAAANLARWDRTALER
jgi:hypothetical protein